MFTGIIENLGIVSDVAKEGTNKHFTIKSTIANELQIDQSVAHNGVCLTVVNIDVALEEYVVTAIKETLDVSTFDSLKTGDKVNLERSVTLEKRLDGHMVQGHVDATGVCKHIKEENGSWLFTFEVDSSFSDLMVDKGSICINGTSLTLFAVNEGEFSVAIIPYTFENTVFHTLRVGMSVNVEFDMMGKYIIKYLKKLQLK